MWIELRRALSVPEAFVVLGVGWHISQSQSLSQPSRWNGGTIRGQSQKSDEHLVGGHRQRRSSPDKMVVLKIEGGY